MSYNKEISDNSEKFDSIDNFQKDEAKYE